jgi:N-acetyl-gamma-glutamyl-phosphate reductase
VGGDTLAEHLPIAPPVGPGRPPQKEATAAAFAGWTRVPVYARGGVDRAGAGALEAGAAVVDLSGAFRLPANEYPRWYGFTHARPDLLASACYSMPEAARRATSARAAGLESRLLRHGRHAGGAGAAARRDHRPEGIIIDAASGTTGAGRKASEDFSFSEVDGDFRAYRVLRHQHTPEIERALALAGQPPLKVTFTPHLLPTRRGSWRRSTAACAGKTGADAAAAVERFVAGKPFLRAAKPDAVRLHPVVGTNRVLLGADADPERGVAVAFAAIDNLVKGAAGQAVQNANLMLGIDETTGPAGLARERA